MEETQKYQISYTKWGLHDWIMYECVRSRGCRLWSKRLRRDEYILILAWKISLWVTAYETALLKQTCAYLREMYNIVYSVSFVTRICIIKNTKFFIMYLIIPKLSIQHCFRWNPRQLQVQFSAIISKSKCGSCVLRTVFGLCCSGGNYYFGRLSTRVDLLPRSVYINRQMAKLC